MTTLPKLSHLSPGSPAEGLLPQLDMAAGTETKVEIEIVQHPAGKTIYVHCQGQTVLRIFAIKTPLTISGHEKTT